MEIFIWFVAATLALDIAVKLLMLSSQNFERKASGVAVDTAANVALLVWAIWVLAHGA